MNKRWLIPLIGLSSGIFFLLAACQSGDQGFECTDAIGCVDIAPNAPIKIGVLQDQSGAASAIGTDIIRSIEVALADRDHTLLNHPIQLQIEDEHCTREGGANAALRIVADTQVIGIIGTTCSDAATTASNIMSGAGLVMISGTNITPSLTGMNGEPGADWQPGYFRTIHNGVYWGPAVAAFAIEKLGVTQAAVIDDGEEFTKQVTHRFEEQFETLGGEIVLATTISRGDPNMEPVLNAIQASGAEFVFAPIFQVEAAQLVIQARALGLFDSLTITLSEAAAVDPWIDSVGEAGVGIYFIVTGKLEGAEIDAFRTRFEATYNKPAQHSVLLFSYDAVQLLLSGIEAAAVRDDDNTLHIGRQALRDALYNTHDRVGITGRISCNTLGDCNSGGLTVVRFDAPAAGIEGLISNVVFSYFPEQ